MNILTYQLHAQVGLTIWSPHDKGVSSNHTHLASQASPFPPRQRSTRPHLLAMQWSSIKNIFFAITNVMWKPDPALYSCCVVSQCTAPISDTTWFTTFPIGFPHLPRLSPTSILSPLSWYPHLLPHDSNLFPYFPIPVLTFPMPSQSSLCLPAILPTCKDEHQSLMSLSDHTFPFRKLFHVINTCHIIEVSAYSGGPC